MIGLHVGTGLRTFALAVGIANYGYLPLPIMEAIWGPESRGRAARAQRRRRDRDLDGRRARPERPVVARRLAQARQPDRDHAGAGGRRAISRSSRRICPAVVTTTIHALGVCAIPLGLIMTGVNLAQYLHEPRELFDLRVSGAAMVLRLGALPIAILALAKFLPCSIELKRVLVVQAAMPTAVIPIIIARLYGGHPRTAVQIVLGTTALGNFRDSALAASRAGVGGRGGPVRDARYARLHREGFPEAKAAREFSTRWRVDRGSALPPISRRYYGMA